MKFKSKQPDASKALKALADPTRLAVLEILLEKDTYVSEFIDQLDIEPTLLSHHLSILRGEDLIAGARQGKTVLYKLTTGTKIRGAKKGLNLGSCKLIFTGESKKTGRRKTKSRR